MTERFPFGPSPRPEPPFPLVNSASFGSARSRPGREAAKRTLDGEDRFGTMKREGKKGATVEGIGEAGFWALVNQAPRDFRVVFPAAILALRP